MPPVFASGMRAAIWMASFRSRAQNQEYAHLLTVLDQWAIGRRQRAVANAHRGGGVRGLQRLARDELPAIDEPSMMGCMNATQLSGKASNASWSLAANRAHPDIPSRVEIAIPRPT
jgi:hypothetical protein